MITRDTLPTIVGTSPLVMNLRKLASRVAAAGGTKVLITGESGVGKDLVARFIHTNSTRARLPFVPINCAGVTESLLESELFGHVRGAFTGAMRDKTGLLQLAHRGTVFLDEIGEMSLRMQALLLRFLENGEVKAVGADATSKVDVRVLAATNRDLHGMVSRGLFREDLLFRIKVVQITVPALRERADDIPVLIEYILGQLGASIVFSEDALKALKAYHWPGNVRELQNVVEQLACLSPDQFVDDVDLPAVVTAELAVRPAHERRRLIADQLFEGLTTGKCSFWEHVCPMFLNRDLTRADLIGLVHKGLGVTGGNYKNLVSLFGMTDPRDYKRFHNFLAVHECSVEYRPFRHGTPRPKVPRFAMPEHANG